MSTVNQTSLPVDTPKASKKHQNQSKNAIGGKSKNTSGSSSGSAASKSAEASADGATSGSGGGIFRPLVVLALPGVNLFRRFSQYKRLPQDPPKDKLEVELERLNGKIVSFLSIIIFLSSFSCQKFFKHGWIGSSDWQDTAEICWHQFSASRLS